MFDGYLLVFMNSILTNKFLLYTEICRIYT